VTHDEQLEIGRELARRLLARYGEHAVLAVGLHGPAAHGGGGTLDLAVVTSGPEVALDDRVLRHRGLVVDLGVIGEPAYLQEAGQIGPAWPLAADQYLHQVALHDPGGFFHKLRHVHEEAVREAGDEVFRAAAGPDLAHALAEQVRAVQADRAGDTTAALFAVREAAVLAALVIGLVRRRTARDVGELLRAAAASDWPPGFGPTFQLAVDPASDAPLAVAALGEALEVLTELARRDGIPFEADDLDAFL
jgi:hypothetical protein